MMTREQVIDKIAEIFINHSDSEGSWEGADICEAVMGFLTDEGRDRLAQCGVCSTWWPVAIYDDCPYWDDHDCGGCGIRNDECSCDDCPDCGIYQDDCECPRCTKCGETARNCTHSVEEAVFQ